MRGYTLPLCRDLGYRLAHEPENLGTNWGSGLDGLVEIVAVPAPGDPQ